MNKCLLCKKNLDIEFYGGTLWGCDEYVICKACAGVEI